VAIAMATTAMGERVLSRSAAASGQPMDEARFNRIYEATARPIRAYLASSLGDAVLADDLVQECFVRLIRSGFDTDDHDHMRNYLFRIATNLMRDHWRRRRPTQEICESVEDGTNLEASISVRSDVQRGLAELSPADRQMLWLAYVEGCTHEEIASRLGLRRSSLKSMLFRARSRMAAVIRRQRDGNLRRRAEDQVLRRLEGRSR
jgi:RNA polymerase sigma-70 factor (ECF subfamily)